MILDVLRDQFMRTIKIFNLLPNIGHILLPLLFITFSVLYLILAMHFISLSTLFIMLGGVSLMTSLIMGFLALPTREQRF